MAIGKCRTEVVRSITYLYLVESFSSHFTPFRCLNRRAFVIRNCHWRHELRSGSGISPYDDQMVQMILVENCLKGNTSTVVELTLSLINIISYFALLQAILPDYLYTSTSG